MKTFREYFESRKSIVLEDARLIDDQSFGVCVCKSDKNDINKVINVEFKKYNFVTKELTHYKMSKKDILNTLEINNER